VSGVNIALIRQYSGSIETKAVRVMVMDTYSPLAGYSTSNSVGTVRDRQTWGK
jgi:hypothetical protein